jgi:inhibitor of cysteine peptidase
MKTRTAALGTIALAAILLGACSMAMGSPGKSTLAASYEEFTQTKNISKQITVNEGSELLVNLPSNPSTGYSWTEPAVERPDVLAQVKSEYVAPGATSVGSAGNQIWTLKASGKGTTTFKTGYSRPWEGGEKDEWTFQLIVTVQ